MNRELALDEARSDIVVAEAPIDLSGTTREIDAAALVQSQALVGSKERAQSDSARRPLNGAGASGLSPNSKELTRNFDELRYSVRSYVPKDEGRGYWDLYRVSEDLFVLIADCRYNEAKWVGVPGERCFKIRYLRSGALVGKNGQHYLAGANAMFSCYPGDAGDGYFIPADTACSLVVVQCSTRALWNELGIDLEQAPMPLRGLATDENQAPQARTFEPTAPISRAFADLLDSRDLFAANLRGWFVEAKAREIIASFVQLLLQKPDLRIGNNRLSRRDRHRILEAKEIVLANIDNVPTIPELAHMVGMNQTKLKAGFKEIVGSTIGAFVSRNQMNLAAKMLTSTDLSVSRISQSFGFRHPGNFTQAFKRHLGRAPREYRRQATGLVQDTPSQGNH